MRPAERCSRGLAALAALLAVVACGNDPAAALLELPPASCGRYCALILHSCHQANTIYTGREDCLSTCAGFSTGGPSNALSGDTLACRYVYARVVDLLPQVFCRNAGPTGGYQCIAPGATPP